MLQPGQICYAYVGGFLGMSGDPTDLDGTIGVNVDG